MKDESNTPIGANAKASLVSGEIRKGEELITTTPIAGTPFNVIQTELGHAIKLGVHRVTEFKESEQEAINMVANRDWDLMLAIIGLTIELSKINKQLSEAL